MLALVGREAASDGLRLLDPQWNRGMIAASIAISLLGAFTSTQLMCQARMSLSLTSVLAWTFLASLTFGFCSIWCLHFVAMLACELDLPIGIDVPLTILSSVLAVFFTFASLASDLLWDRYQRRERKRLRVRRKKEKAARRADVAPRKNSTIALSDPPHVLSPWDASGNRLSEIPPPADYLDAAEREDAESNRDEEAPERTNSPQHRPISVHEEASPSSFPATQDGDVDMEPLLPNYAESSTSFSDSQRGGSNDPSTSHKSSSILGSTSSSVGLGNLLNIAFRGTKPAKNAFVQTGESLYHGFTVENVVKGFFWSLAITSMHYVGILALYIPGGYAKFSVPLVLVSSFISWIVCIVGCILMPQMETHLSQQVLFSVVATCGVAAMHFTGMEATEFWSIKPPSELRGYPTSLTITIASIGITTCILANGLLAHSATVSRNKLAEIVWTRRKLWRTIAQKENAEAAAAARSDFIASASHEIRTPLHHLQGYSDLLSRTELTEEGRVLLLAIQRATKTLSLITNNVLDWSKLERETDATCRPVALDIRTVCESILVLLPNQDDDAEVEIYVVVQPTVPRHLFLDETYIHRILMNLLSNSLKFTRVGYVSLLIGVEDGKLVATVKDTGCGVPPSFLPQLFEPFKQAQTRVGSQRGTGLGLSIIKQLLSKMNGSIEVESRHPDSEDIGPDETGSTFTIGIPVEGSSTSEPLSQPTIERPTVAIFKMGDFRSTEGLINAWREFGFKTVIVESFAELSTLQFKYIWADACFLEHNPAILHQLLGQNDHTVLVPYHSQLELDRLPGVLTTPSFVTLQKPLMWHSFDDRISLATQLSTKSALRTVRFAATVDILNDSSALAPTKMGDLAPGLTAKNLTVLMVEDNPINQKLGTKMLSSLGYTVILANNGVEAISQIVLYDVTVDAILMDQSMPIKDGVTATREIRELERNGTLSRRRPIIALTAVVNAESRALFKEAGAEDFLSAL